MLNYNNCVESLCIVDTIIGAKTSACSIVHSTSRCPLLLNRVLIDVYDSK